jgi:hypothetical protein
MDVGNDAIITSRITAKKWLTLTGTDKREKPWT